MNTHQSTTLISAIICTHNRSDVLARAIESLISQSLDKSLYEIIIVDNASTDETRTICESFLSLRNFSYLYESKPGLSVARNTGINASRSEYTAFLDDDAVASPNWLENIIRVFEQTEPKPESVGGKILPMWEAPRPDWLPKDRETFITILDYGDDAKYLQYPDVLFGTNMSFRRSTLRNIGGFRSEFGRKKNKLLSCEESDIYQKFAIEGYPVRYAPCIIVHHQVPAKRLKKRWMYKRHYWQGRSEALLISLRSGESALADALKISLVGLLRAGKDVMAALSAINAPQALFRAIADGCYHIGRLVTFLPVYFDPGHEPENNEMINRDSIMHNVNAIFDGGIGFIGFNISSTTIQNGNQFQIMYVWECLKPIEYNYSVFIHFTKAGAIVFQNDHLLRTKEWQQGDIIRDTQFVHVPVKLEGELEMSIGVLDPRVNRKLAITHPGSGKPDQHNCLIIEAFNLNITS